MNFGNSFDLLLSFILRQKVIKNASILIYSGVLKYFDDPYIQHLESMFKANIEYYSCFHWIIIIDTFRQLLFQDKYLKSFLNFVHTSKFSMISWTMAWISVTFEYTIIKKCAKVRFHQESIWLFSSNKGIHLKWFSLLNKIMISYHPCRDSIQII
jgi:hypothetical protein